MLRIYNCHSFFERRVLWICVALGGYFVNEYLISGLINEVVINQRLVWDKGCFDGETGVYAKIDGCVGKLMGDAKCQSNG